MNRRSFTIIELMIVVLIVGVLAVIALPNFLNAHIRSKITQTLIGLKTYRTIQHMYLLDYGDIPGSYMGKEEHCPYINLGYIAAPLRDPFADEKDLMFIYLEGMLYSHPDLPIGGEWPLEKHEALNPGLTAEWLRAGEPYVLFGEGPVGTQSWDLEQWFSLYDVSNGIHSNGCFVMLGIRGKGQPGFNLGNRKCH